MRAICETAGVRYSMSAVAFGDKLKAIMVERQEVIRLNELQKRPVRSSSNERKVSSEDMYAGALGIV